MKTAAAILAALIAFTLGLLSCTPPANSAESTPGVTYSAHVQRIGWQAPVDDGATAGTTGRALRVEALRLSPSGGATLSWRGHVQKQGWQGWRDTPNMIGTTGRGLRLEAFQITVKDSGQLYGDVSVEYRAHVQGVGWQPWRRDGQTAGTTGKALRIEAVQIRLIPRVTPTATATPTASASPSPTAPTAEPTTRIAVTADTGIDDAAGRANLAAIGNAGVPVLIAGDLAYDPARESEYCAMVKARITAPVELIPGNHEAIADGDGVFTRYTACLPDRLGVTGSYSTGQWYADQGPVRVISIAPAIDLPSGTRTYAAGTADRAWLVAAIREGKAAGKWVIVVMHKPCFTLGIHGCASGASLTDLLAAEKVDLVVAGHDHIYARTHQIAGTVAAPVVVDRDGTYLAGKGTVFAIVGNGGHNPRTVAALTSIWAKASGTNSAGGITYGYGSLEATPDRLTWRLVRTGGGSLTDTWTVTR